MGSVSVPAIADGVAAGADAEAAGAAAEGAASYTAIGEAGVASTTAEEGAAIDAASYGSAATSTASWYGTAAEGASVISTGASAYGQHQAGVANANDAKMRARQAGLEAGQKQIDIRQNMLKALASQNAAAGQSGIGTGGSFGANVNRQIKQNQNDLLALNADTSATEAQYGAQASNATKAGNLKAGASLMDLANTALS